MKSHKKIILLTGGGTGGHIYPLLAIAERIQEINEDDVSLVYVSPKNELSSEFSERGIKTYNITGSKIRRYLTFANFIDIPKFIFSIFEALAKLYIIMPDIVFSKGGPGSFAVVLAARFYRIPVIIHESDSIPSLTTKLSSKFAKRIGVSFKTAFDYFPKSKTFMSGNPIRTCLLKQWLAKDKAKEYLKFNPQEPLVLVLGGSQGSVRINTFVLNNLLAILSRFQVYHLVGTTNIENTERETNLVLRKASETTRARYRFVGSFLDPKELKYAFNAADVVISRAGAGAIFEIAAFGKPSILIPLEESANNHQKMNAYEYAKNNAAIVVEEANFTINIILDQITRLLKDPEKIALIEQSAQQFAKPEATDIVVKEILAF